MVEVPFTAQTITFGTVATQVMGTPLALTKRHGEFGTGGEFCTTGVCTVSGSTATLYSIPITIGSATVGTLKLTVP